VAYQLLFVHWYFTPHQPSSLVVIPKTSIEFLGQLMALEQLMVL
jgi:hypothetical protein